MRQTNFARLAEKKTRQFAKFDAKHFEAIENLIFSRKSGKTVELPNGEIVDKENGKLTFMKNKG